MLPGGAQLLQQKGHGHAVDVARLRGAVQVDVRVRVDPHQRQVRRVLQVPGHRACRGITRAGLGIRRKWKWTRKRNRNRK